EGADLVAGRALLGGEQVVHVIEVDPERGVRVGCGHGYCPLCALRPRRAAARRRQREIVASALITSQQESGRAATVGLAWGRDRPGTRAEAGGRILVPVRLRTWRKNVANIWRTGARQYRNGEPERIALAPHRH